MARVIDEVRMDPWLQQCELVLLLRGALAIKGLDAVLGAALGRPVRGHDVLLGTPTHVAGPAAPRDPCVALGLALSGGGRRVTLGPE